MPVNRRLSDRDTLFPEMLYNLVYRNVFITQGNKVIKDKPALLSIVVRRTPGFHIPPANNYAGALFFLSI
jgi:hypothetical protein